MPASAIAEGTRLRQSPPKSTLWRTTKYTPAIPSARPIHCQVDTRSPIHSHASTTVRIGCRLTSIALVPAAMPESRETNTPPRYSPCTHNATRARSRYSAIRLGQRARVATATTLINTATSTKRHARKP
jgi:hypothetical protein